jgi:N-acetylglucosamine-6-phosphate deacetylase
MKNWLLQNGRFVMNSQIIQGDLHISEGKILHFFPIAGENQAKVVAGIESSLKGESYQTIDCQDALIGPGFIDIHVHGGGGADVMEATMEAYQQMAYTHGQHGTTRFLLTTVTASHEDLLRVSRFAKEWVDQMHQTHHTRSVVSSTAPTSTSTKRATIPAGALPLGIHLEGPYIALDKKGAQNGAYIRPFSMEEFNQYQEVSNGLIKLITLAPEKLPYEEVITQLHEQGVVVSIGHTEATYDEVDRAFQLGAKHITHLCNAMPSIHHRSPGPITYALNHDGLTVEFIADGLHVHSAIIELALRAKKHDEVAIVTDAIGATGMDDGEYELGELPVWVKQGKATLEDGTLAGSCLDMEKAYHFLSSELGLDEVQLFQMMSTTPARILGINDQLGSLEIGKIADLVVFREGTLTDVMTAGQWIKGGIR